MTLILGKVMIASTVVVAVLDAISKPTIERYLRMGEAHLPHLTRLGLGNVISGEFKSRFEAPDHLDTAFACDLKSTWADSVMGHRELLGFIDPTNYDLFRDGFPADYVAKLSRIVGRPLLFNKRCGGDDAIAWNHDEHVRTPGSVILYASMCDPIAQFAAWEERVPHTELADIGRIGFDLSQEMGLKVTRTISRPYVVKEGKYVRTTNRKDAVIKLPAGVELFVDVARSRGVYCVSVGKCADVVNTMWDVDQKLPEALSQDFKAFLADKNDKNPFSLYGALSVLSQRRDLPLFLMVNFPDTDSVYGHNRNVSGALRSLEAFDRSIPLLEAALPQKSLLIITGDHGMVDGGDYGYHGREPVFALGLGKGLRIADEFGTPEKRGTYAAVGQLCARAFGFEKEYIERCRLESILR